MRIGVGGIHIECSTFNARRTEAEDFRVGRDAALLGDPHFAPLREFPIATFLPTLYARAIPGGPVSAQAYAAFREEFLSRLRALGPLDGLFLSLHGAMFVEGREDAEGDWVNAAREVVGPDVPIAVSFDLHGNLSRRVVDAIDMFTAYRTAPHVDLPETMRRAVGLLTRSRAEDRRPFVMWTPVPVLLSGERTSTVRDPARGLYAELPAIENAPGIWDASILVGYAWADEPRATAAVVLTGTDEAEMRRASKELALKYWNARERFDFGLFAGSIDACLDLALDAPTAPVIVADSGDNPTAGGVGDRADVLAALQRRRVRDAWVVGIADPPAVAAAFRAGIGAKVSLRVGGALQPDEGPTVAVDGEVVLLLAGENLPDREAVVRSGGITLALSARRRPYHYIHDFKRLGLDPQTARLIVVKSGYLSPELAPIANPALLALSPGAVDQAIERHARRRMPAPTFPFQRGFDWSPHPMLSARRGDAS